MSTELHWLTSLSLYLKGSFSIGGAKGEAVELDGFPFNKRVAVLPV